jgi:5-methylcytosine-specific restriction endonuclease McrA
VSAHLKATNEQIVAAYRSTGSVWRAAKELGMAGQAVHERLVALGHSLAGRKWSAAEVAELTLLAGTCTIGEIARRLGRPYAGVACKLSELGLVGTPRPRTRKVPRGAGFDKTSVRQHMRALDRFSGKLTQYCRANGLDVEILAQAIQRTDADWWQAYVARHSDLPQRTCPYCAAAFIPMSGRQQYCTRSCSSDARRDRDYFGGNRRQTIGLAERTCQLCGRQGAKGLSAHHLVGKDNDPTDQLLIALCLGCHHVVGLLAGRAFVDEPSGWESLINLVMLRRKGGELVDAAGPHLPEDIAGIEVAVQIEWLSVADVEAPDEAETA